jgi:hypothetical protein
MMGLFRTTQHLSIDLDQASRLLYYLLFAYFSISFPNQNVGQVCTWYFRQLIRPQRRRFRPFIAPKRTL